MNFNSEPEEARRHINKFVEETTKNVIKEFLPPKYITPQTIAVMVNAAFFKGDWKSKFEKQHTEKTYFYKNNHKPVYVDMMIQTNYFNYGMIFNINFY